MRNGLTVPRSLGSSLRTAHQLVVFRSQQIWSPIQVESATPQLLSIRTDNDRREFVGRSSISPLEKSFGGQRSAVAVGNVLRSSAMTSSGLL